MTDQPYEGAVAKPYIIVCANGADHRDYGVGEVSAAVSERAARDAADFMDDERDSSPWECGPHSVRRQSDPSAQECTEPGVGCAACPHCSPSISPEGCCAEPA